MSEDKASDKELATQCRSLRRRTFDPWVRTIPWRRAWQPTPVFMLENPLDRGMWWATVYRVTQGQTWLKQLSMPATQGKFSSVQFSLSVVPDSLRPHGLQLARLPSPSPTPGAHSNSCALSWWCHPAISSSVVPFSSHLQSFPASRSFQMSQFFTSDDQSIGVSASESVLPMNIQDWFPLGRTGWIYLQSKGLKSLLQHHSSKASILWSSAFFIVQLSHPYMTTGRTITLIRWTFVGKVMSLLFNMLSRLVITFLPRRKPLLISWLQSPSAVILEPPKNTGQRIRQSPIESIGLQKVRHGWSNIARNTEQRLPVQRENQPYYTNF